MDRLLDLDRLRFRVNLGLRWIQALHKLNCLFFDFFSNFFVKVIILFRRVWSFNLLIDIWLQFSRSLLQVLVHVCNTFLILWSIRAWDYLKSAKYLVGLHLWIWIEINVAICFHSYLRGTSTRGLQGGHYIHIHLLGFPIGIQEWRSVWFSLRFENLVLILEPISRPVVNYRLLLLQLHLITTLKWIIQIRSNFHQLSFYCRIRREVTYFIWH